MHSAELVGAKSCDSRRVILLGFDAAVLNVVDEFVDVLPNFKRLTAQGVSCEARPSVPAGTPANWTTIATGAYSSTHGIYGFDDMTGAEPLKRIARTFNSRRNRAENIWQAAERSGKKAVLIHYPTAHPWTVKDSIAVGGSGVSSDEWCMAAPAIYSTDNDGTDRIVLRRAEDWERLPASKRPPLEATISSLSDATVRQTLYGTTLDSGAPDEDDFTVVKKPRPLEILLDTDSVEKLKYRLLVLDSTGSGYDRVLVFRDKSDDSPLAELAIGKWVGPIYDVFPNKAGSTTEGLFYLKLQELSQDGRAVRIYRTFINRSLKYTHPESIAQELRASGIPYLENLEQAIAVGLDSFDLAERSVEPLEILLEMIRLQSNSIAGISQRLLSKYPWDIACVQIHAPDSINHAIGGYLSPMAPRFASEGQIAVARDLMKRCYIAMDELLGRIWDECKRDDDVLVVVSDHGSVPSWRRVNTPGLLLRGGFASFSKTPSGRYVYDWCKTKVFQGQGNPGFFVNLRGRYPEGCVDPEDYEALRDDFIRYLWSVRDPETGEGIYSKILKREDAAYLGLYGNEVGDIVEFTKPAYYPAITQVNYFVEEQMKLITSPSCFTSRLGATHPYHPDEKEGPMSTNGVFFAVGPGMKAGYRRTASIHLADVAPTIAHVAGIHRPANADGQVVQDIFE